MVLIKNKRASHVGFILSFVIFMTSILFLYTMIQPNFQSNMEKRNVLDFLSEKLVDESKMEYDVLSVNSQVDGNCFNFKSIRNIAEISSNVSVKDASDNSLNAYYSGDDIIVDTSSKFVKILEASSFSPLGNFNSECSPDVLVYDSNYTIGSVRTQESIFSSEIIELIEKHENEYTSLKNSLGIPSTSEFSINFTYQNGTSVSSGDAPLDSNQINIYSDTQSIQYINSNGVQETGTLQIRVW